jgi:hypothetical protein
MGVNEFYRYLQNKELSPTMDNERKWVYVYSYLNDYRRPVGRIKTSEIPNLTDPDEFVVSCTLKAIYE